jgi:hypothetical protein
LRDGLDLAFLIEGEMPNSVISSSEDNHVFGGRMSQFHFFGSTFKISIVLRKSIHAKNEINIGIAKNNRIRQERIIAHLDVNIRNMHV